MATPVAAEPAGATPADDATTSEAAQAFVDNVKACASDADAVATLVTPNLVKELGGYDSIDAAKADGFFSDATVRQCHDRRRRPRMTTAASASS